MCKLLETTSHILWGENIFTDYFDGAACKQSVFAHAGVGTQDPAQQNSLENRVPGN